jgi:hypothetical protein
MLAKLLQLAIYDVQANTHVVLSTIQDGVDGAGGFFYTEEEDLLSIEDDQDYLVSFLCRMDVRLLGNSAKRATLMSMVGKDCVISGLGMDGFFQFGHVTNFTGGVATATGTVKLVAVEQVDKTTVFRVIAQKRTTKAYVSGFMAGAVTASENMMAMYQLGSGTSTMLHGLFNTGGVGSVTGEILTMTYASPLATAFVATTGYYLYPFQASPVYFSLIKAPSAGSIVVNNLRLLGYDATSTVTNLHSTLNPTSAVRQYAGGTVPAGNVFIAGAYEMTTVGAGTIITFRQPMIGRLNPQGYTKF